MRIGIDLGGTKIEGIAMSDDGEINAKLRLDTPQGHYENTVEAICDLVSDLEADQGTARAIGIGTPGSISPITGLMQNCNSVCLNGKDLLADLSNRLSAPVRIANDADCFALSEAVDGAGAQASTVFGVILGTGVGGGLVVGKKLVAGPNALAGEWGHNPLFEGVAQRTCYCGRINCVETWISGPAVEREYQAHAQRSLSAFDIASESSDVAVQTMDRFLERLAKALGVVINMIDPECIVFGGGLSNIDRIYTDLPQLLPAHIMPDTCKTVLKKAEHGDSSGVRGAAWLWP